MFKVVHIQTTEQLIHLSRYIHLNPLVSYLVKEENFLSYPWSSLQYYLEDYPNDIINPKVILDSFSSSKDYLKFVLDQVDYGKELERIKHLTLE
ncbi:hypothetical protein HYS93_02760 [Candidatus Daviesbacteria bacterium]|nr:hypothetical protein [Candidatus Daviesbacteria bacterium]